MRICSPAADQLQRTQGKERIMWNANIANAGTFFGILFIILSAGCDRPAPSPAPRTAERPVLDRYGPSVHRDDVARDRSWILNARGLFVFHAATGKLQEVPLPSWQWVDTRYACPPDLALGPDGAAVVTSNVVPVLWRVDPDTLAVTVHEVSLDSDKDKDVGFYRLTYSAREGAFFAVSQVDGSQWRIDRALRKGRKIAGLQTARDGCGVKTSRAAD